MKMPYLHWETSRRREQISQEIDKIVLRTTEDLANKEANAKRQRQDKWRSLVSSDISKTPKETPQEQERGHEDKYEDASEVVNRVLNGRRPDAAPSRRKNELGCYLLAASRLYEGMTTYRDRMLLRKYLPKDPPIHPRRTLDQAYYWAPKSTKKRDKDQVIYRGTTVSPDAFHVYDKKKGEWPDHDGLEGKDCSICRTNIRKVSQVIMVDQLWMWVLGEKTLITCFPKRYGANKQDYSGVHKSIRTKLENLGSNRIRTVFELALIVLDECTTTLFDRTKSLDKRPQVIDEFSMAIGKIVSRYHLTSELKLTRVENRCINRPWRLTDSGDGRMTLGRASNHKVTSTPESFTYHS